MIVIRMIAPLVMLAVLAQPAFAAEIYFWTDENGVRHYSNTGIPEEAEDIELAPEEKGSPPDAAPENATGSAVRGMGDELEELQQDKRERRYREALAQWNQRVSEEREQLESQIEAIEGRALSRFLTQGMKDAQLAPLKEKLSLLNTDPETYFGRKAPIPQDYGLAKAPEA